MASSSRASLSATSPSILLSVATSVDGFIADSEGGVAWLDRFNSDLCVQAQMTALLTSASVIIMGRNTYDQVMGFVKQDCIPWPYPRKRCVVVTSRPLTEEDLPKSSSSAAAAAEASSSHEQAEVMVETIQKDESLEGLVRRLKKESAHEGPIWLMGGTKLAQSFLQRNLVDEIELNIVPVLLGRGISLFGSPANDHNNSGAGGAPQQLTHVSRIKDLNLMESEPLENGMVRVKYRFAV